MSRRLLALPLAGSLVLFAACGDDDAPADGQPEGGSTLGVAEMAGEGDSPAFALVRGADTLLVERYTLEGDRVQGVMRDPTGSYVEYDATYAQDGGDRTLSMTIHPSDPGASPPIQTTFTLRGDSVQLRHQRGDSVVTQADAIPANTLPYLSPSMGMMALLVTNAREMVGDSGQVPLLAASISQNPVVVSPLVLWRGDTAMVIGNEMNQFRLVFEDGKLVSAENAPQQMRAVLLPPGFGVATRRPAAAAEGADASAAETDPPAAP